MEKTPNIWRLVGIVLAFYAFLATGAGIYYIFNPYLGTKLGALNPSLWWGLVIGLTSIIFLIIGGRGET